MHSPTIIRRRIADPPSPSIDPDAERFAALYAQHRDELARYCRSILRHDQDVEDALQSTMAKAFAALRTETREIALRPWLFRIAHNEAISIVRRRVDAAELDDHDGGDPDLVPQAVETRERLRLLREDLGDLPQRQRSALVLRELSGLGHREIADVLGTSPSAVKQAIYEARCALGDCAAGRSLTCDGVRRALSDGDGRTASRRRLRAHLRSCRSCRSFDAALRQRPQDLGALFPAGPALGVGGAVAGLVSAAGGGAAVGGGSTTVGLGGAAVGAAGSGGLLGGGLAGAGVAKLAGIAAVAVAVGGGAVAVERGTPAPSGSRPAGGPVVVRDSSAAPAPTAGPALRLAAAPGGTTAVPVIAPRPGPDDSASRGEDRPAPPRDRGTEAPRGQRRDANRSPNAPQAPTAGPTKRPASTPANGRPARPAQPSRGAVSGRPAKAAPGRSATAGAPSRGSRPASAGTGRSPKATGQSPGSADKRTGSTPSVSPRPADAANDVATGHGSGSAGRPAATGPPPDVPTTTAPPPPASAAAPPRG